MPPSDEKKLLPGAFDPPPDDSDAYIGHTFGGRYEIVSKLGEGSQARVYLGRHVLIDRLVAVKFLLPVLAADKNLVARFLNEGRAAGALGHPNIVESLDMGCAPDGAPYLVLELLKGRTLAEEIILSRALAPSRAAYIASQIASALAAAHAREIVHRDLKPANVLLVERGGRPDHVKVLDFGISKFTSGGSRVTTIKGEPLGTPGFMAPEQIEDPLGIDSRADVYGLGATLYDMLAGEPPFADVGFPKVLRLVVEEEPRKLADLRPDLPVGLVAIVERAMSKSPAARFQTMAAFEEALLAFADEPARFRSVAPRFSGPPTAPPSSSRAPAAPAFGPAPASAAAASPARSDEKPRPTANARRKRTLAAAAVLLLLALALVVGRRTASPVVSDPRPIEGPKAQSPQPQSLPNTAPSTETVAPVVAAAPGTATRASPASERSATHSPARSQVRTTPLSTASHSPTTSSPETANCSPPFYYEGKKKLFKPGCI